jgi:thioredoxin-related protein
MPHALRRILAALLIAGPAFAADFGEKGGPEPVNLAEAAAALRRDGHDMELLISYGTSKGGSAGHFALAIRDAKSGDDTVYSANYYADRTDEHARDFYNEDLVARIPKMEYLYATRSTVSQKASFGLDFGEVYKRSVVGVRIFGVPEAERAALATYLARINEDFRKRAADTEYHDGEVKYGYMHLNCAKTIGAAFKYGAGYKALEVKSPRILPGRPIAALANANIPTEMAMKLLAEFDKRGYRMEAVLYRKYPGSSYVDPHEEEKIAFKDLPNRFPSVLSLDFRNDEGDYEDYDNLFAMYLLYNIAKYSVRVDPGTRRIAIDVAKEPMRYADARELAERQAQADSRGFLRRLATGPQGRKIDTLTPVAAPARRGTSFTVPPWFKNSFLDLKDDAAEAETQGKRLLVYIGQDGCPYCAALFKGNFAQPDILEYTRKHFDAVELNLWGDRPVGDFDGERLTEKSFAAKHRVRYTPTLLFFDGNGRQVLRIDGYYPPAKFLAALRYVGDDLASKEPFPAYLARRTGKLAAGVLPGEAFFQKPPHDLRAGGKPIAVFFEQADCAACTELHRDVFTQAATREQLARFRAIQLDRWGETPVTTPQGEQLSSRAWADRLNVAYAPTAVFFDGGREVMRIDAMLKGFHVQSVMDYVASGAYKEQPSFQRFIQARADRLREAGATVDLWK